MKKRLRYPEIAPEGYAALSHFGHYVNTATTLDSVLLGSVYLRASAVNGCRFCTELHKAELRKHHEPESRIEAVISAPESEAFTPRERAALHWTDVLTRLPAGGASEAEYDAISIWFSGRDLVDLSFAIANINAWNRMGIAFEPAWRPKKESHTSTAAVPDTQAVSPQALHEEGESAAAGGSSSEEDGGKVGTD